MIKLIWWCLFLCVLSSSGVFAERKLTAVILDEASHDPSLFTQGFYLDGDHLIESSGGYGRSLVRRYPVAERSVAASDKQASQPLASPLASNTKSIEQKLPAKLFAEGLTRYGDEVFLLTWKAERALVLDAEQLTFKRALRYEGEGWGLTHNDGYLINSNGSDTLYFRKPANLDIARQIRVHNSWRKYSQLNELEFAEGSIWANVWQTPIILQISPADGQVLGIASLKDLENKNSTIANHSVLNGIAYDPQRKAFWITGKLWPKRYLVRFE